MANTPFQLRDLSFVLFEHLKVQDQGDLDRDTIEAFLEAGVTFCHEFLSPIYAKTDTVGCTLNDDGSVTTPPGLKEAYAQWGEDGWSSIPHPEEHGGQDLPQVMCSVIDELIIASCCCFHNYVGLNRACSNMLLRWASTDQIVTWARPMIANQWQGTMCLTERGAGSDVGASLTKATHIEGDRYTIQGEKVFITSGEHDMAHQFVHIVLARVEEDGVGSRGLSIFIVPKFRLDEQGQPTIPNDVHCIGIEEKMGLHGSVTTTMKFGENDGCEGYLIGERKQGLRIMFTIMNEERILVGQQGQALASTAYGLALQYAKQRVQGSSIAKGKKITKEKVTIIEHPDVRRMLMTVKAQQESCRALMFRASQLIDEERRTEGEAKAKVARRLAFLTPICKAYGSAIGFEACAMAMEVFGGYGYCTEYRVEQLVRDAWIALVYEGTNGIQAIDLMFRKFAKDKGAELELILADIGSFAARSKGQVRGALDDEFDALAFRAGEVGKVALALGGFLAEEDLEAAALRATPFLRLLGNLICGDLMLEQALIAEAKLTEMGAPAETADRTAWVGDDDEKRFYASKADTARFFINQLLSENSWLAQQITCKDRSALHVAL